MMSENRYRLNIEQVRRFLPHRDPFLMVDRVLEIQPTGDINDPTPGPAKEGTRVVAIKNVTYNEPCFRGHFPEISLFPGVLVVEAMAQTGCFSLFPYFEKDLERFKRQFQCILIGVDGARFRKPVVPGDTLRIESVVKKCRGKIWVFGVTATVDGSPVAEADVMANLILRPDLTT